MKLPLLVLVSVLAALSASAQTNTIQLRNGANTTTLIAPSGGNYTLTLPAGAGTNGQVLSTNGSGTLSWTTALVVQSDKVGINTANPDYPLRVNNPATAGTVQENDRVLRLERAGDGFDFFVTNSFNNANYSSGAADYAANVVGKQLVMNFGGVGQFIFGDNVGPWSDGHYDLGATYARWRHLYVGTIKRNYRADVTGGTHTVQDTDSWIVVNRAGSTTITLPNPALAENLYRELMIKTVQPQTVISASSNVVPLNGDGAGTAILPGVDGAWATLVCDGTNWVIMQSGQ